MCGRFTLTDISTDQIRDLFLIDDIPDLRPRYNISPTQGVAAIRVNRDTGNRELAILTWGLVPSWAKDPSIGSRMINARAETVHEKPAYRTALRYKRCLVLADGFYEWTQMAGRKQPMYIRREDHGLLAFAGLWEYWASPDGSEIESCTIITTDANPFMARYHHRMPVVLEAAAHDSWLDTSQQNPSRVLPLLQPYAGNDLIAYPVTLYVNSPRNDDPGCLEPLVDDPDAPVA